MISKAQGWTHTPTYTVPVESCSEMIDQSARMYVKLCPKGSFFSRDCQRGNAINKNNDRKNFNDVRKKRRLPSDDPDNTTWVAFSSPS